MKTLLSLATVAIIVASLISIWTSVQRTRAADAECRAIAARQQEIETRIAAAQQRIHTAEQKQVQLRADLAAAHTQLKVRTAAAKTPAAPIVPLPVLLDHDPKLRELYRAQFRSMSELRYLPLFRELKLPPDQQAQFLDLLTEWDQGRLDVQTAAADQHYAPNDPAIAEIQKKTDAVVDEKLKALLGNDGFAQLRQFQSNIWLEGLVNDVSSMVANDRAPLTGEQATHLLETLSGAKPANTPAGRADQLDLQKVLADAKTYLSSAQFTALHADLGFIRLGSLSKAFYQQQGPMPEAGSGK